MSDRIRQPLYTSGTAPPRPRAAPQRKMAVELALEDWHFVTCALLTAPYMRAKPVLEEIERVATAVDAQDQEDRALGRSAVETVQHLEARAATMQREYERQAMLLKQTDDLSLRQANELRELRKSLRKRKPPARKKANGVVAEPEAAP
jgi:hypothetical protein